MKRDERTGRAKTDLLEHSEDSDLFEVVSIPSEKRTRLDGVVIGRLVEVAEGGALVDFPGNPSERPVPARAAVALSAEHREREIALVFEDGDALRPVALGLIQRPEALSRSGDRRDVEIDGERLVLEAEKEIVLRCGKASLVLSRDGKIYLRGTNLLSRSSGPNRIKGGSVQIN